MITAKRHKRRLTKEERSERDREALSRAINPLGSLNNYPAIFNGFLAKGIPESEIKPRENVFTFHAWKALGRHVRKGQHGVRIVSFIPDTKEEIDPESGEKKLKAISRPTTAIVFHISQTDPDSKGVA